MGFASELDIPLPPFPPLGLWDWSLTLNGFTFSRNDSWSFQINLVGNQNDTVGTAVTKSGQVANDLLGKVETGLEIEQNQFYLACFERLFGNFILLGDINFDLKLLSYGDLFLSDCFQRYLK